MKYKNLVLMLTVATFGLSVGVAQAETIGELPSVAPAAATAVAAAPNDNELEMFRFALEMDKEAFVKKSMGLDAEQEKKFMAVYYEYNAKLVKLNDKRLAIIADYASSFDKMTDAKAGELVKRTLEFRKQRIALVDTYYGKIAKATSKTVAARFLQVENILQGAADVAIGSKLPLMAK
jgi:hypothetical protein